VIPHRAQVWRLAAHADGAPGPEHFRLAEEALAEPGEGQVLVRALWLGMDPFPRLRISGDPKRAPQVSIGEVMVGRGVAEVVRSRAPELPEGTVVAGEIGWRDWGVLDGDVLKPVRLGASPVRHALGVLGPSGLAAWCALLERGQAKAGETVLISAAAGAVGSTAAQIARLRGCKVVGVGGSEPQLAFLRELGVAAVDHTSHEPLAAQIGRQAPEGVDLFLDLVAGEVFDAGLAALKPHGRAVLVGTVADYNDPAGQAPQGPRPNLTVILKRLTLKGFLVADHAAKFPQAMAELSGWVASGELKVRERIVEGFENTPQAFAGLFGAEFVGKQLVRVAADAD
jgi:NADPH-dependent curcumin reductase CurA